MKKFLLFFIFGYLQAAEELPHTAVKYRSRKPVDVRVNTVIPEETLNNLFPHIITIASFLFKIPLAPYAFQRFTPTEVNGDLEIMTYCYVKVPDRDRQLIGNPVFTTLKNNEYGDDLSLCKKLESTGQLQAFHQKTNAAALFDNLKRAHLNSVHRQYPLLTFYFQNMRAFFIQQALIASLNQKDILAQDDLVHALQYEAGIEELSSTVSTPQARIIDIIRHQQYALIMKNSQV